MYFQVEKKFTVLTNVLSSRKKSSLFLLMYYKNTRVLKKTVEKEFTVLTYVLPSRKIQKATALKKHCNHNCIYTRITVLKKHCNSAKVIYSTKLYGKYKNTRVVVLKKTL